MKNYIKLLTDNNIYDTLYIETNPFIGGLTMGIAKRMCSVQLNSAKIRKVEKKDIYQSFIDSCDKIAIPQNVTFCTIKWYKRALKEDWQAVLCSVYELYQSTNCHAIVTCITLKAMALNRIERNKSGVDVDNFASLCELAVDTKRHMKKRNVFSTEPEKLQKISDCEQIRKTGENGICWRYRTQAHEIAEIAYLCDKSFSVPLSFNSNTAEGKTNQRKAKKLCLRIRESYPDIKKITPISLNHLVQLYATGNI